MVPRRPASTNLDVLVPYPLTSFRLERFEDDVVTKGRELRVYRGYSDEVRSVAVSPDGRTFLSASHDRTICLWPRED